MLSYHALRLDSVLLSSIMAMGVDHRFKTEEEAVTLANATAMGLSGLSLRETAIYYYYYY